VELWVRSRPTGWSERKEHGRHPEVHGELLAKFFFFFIRWLEGTDSFSYLICPVLFCFPTTSLLIPRF
jgi:hypothetical protein